LDADSSEANRRAVAGDHLGIVQAGPHVEHGVPYIRPADMTDEGGLADAHGIQRTSGEIALSYRRSTIRTGDLVCSIGPSFGKVMRTPAWLDGGNLTQGTARVAVASSYDTQFIFWFLRSRVAVAQWESSVGGATFRALNLGPLAETLLVVPAAAEQHAIGSFLSRETARLDLLTAEAQRAIALLQERRAALISAAVTGQIDVRGVVG
jgi:type I restriction enzyme S subunit